MAYTILKPGIGPGSGNVGDQLVLENTKRLIAHETGIDEFQVYHRETDLRSVLNKINDTNAVIMPVFEISNQVNSLYRLTDDITNIEVPLIPMGAGWNAFPGDHLNAEDYELHEDAFDFISQISKQTEIFGTRDDYTTQVLRRHGIGNSALVGDCAWYKLEALGKEIATPSQINRIVFTTPHRRMYMEQAKEIIEFIQQEFPEAELFCSLHNEPYDHDRELAEYATGLGYEVVWASLDTDNIGFYSDCDLHVGYRLHGHVGFLRNRLPSVLIHEDSRGVGLTHTLGTGGFNGFKRRLSPNAAAYARKLGSLSGKEWLSERLIAPPNDTTPDKVKNFVRNEIESGFESYSSVGTFIDRTYESNMRQLLQSLPT